MGPCTWDRARCAPAGAAPPSPTARRILGRISESIGGARPRIRDPDHLAVIDDIAAIIVGGELDRLADADLAELASL